ncbi:MAG: hypothetical protein NVS3B19_05630 [Ginsengibacter sp.]
MVNTQPEKALCCVYLVNLYYKDRLENPLLHAGATPFAEHLSSISLNIIFMIKILLNRFYFFLGTFLFVGISFFLISANSKPLTINLAKEVRIDSPTVNLSTSITIYDSLHLDQLGLSKDAFNKAIKGVTYYSKEGKLNNENIVSIVDFSLPSNKKRLFVIDLKNYKLLFNTYVAHGRNSGKDVANEFSNDNSSYKSSLGFYITKDTYDGKHGYSLKLDGQEKGINDNALSRGIVMHSAWYVAESIVKSQGFIGRSQGCPALPESEYKPIISQIKGGTCLFLYSPDNKYALHSDVLKSVS